MDKKAEELRKEVLEVRKSGKYLLLEMDLQAWSDEPQEMGDYGTYHIYGGVSIQKLIVDTKEEFDACTAKVITELRKINREPYEGALFFLIYETNGLGKVYQIDHAYEQLYLLDGSDEYRTEEEIVKDSAIEN